jgi:hypothetical protein
MSATEPTPGSRPKRAALSKKTRFEVFKRDAFACQYCGAHPPKAILECDHIVPVAEGGVNDLDNLVTACFDCNRGKGAVSLSVAPQSLSEKAALVAEREEQLRGYAQVMEAKRQRLEAETWKIMDLFHPGADTVPRDSFGSTKRFIEKLGFHEVQEAAEIALGGPAYGKRLFRYFCGVCWNKVRELEGGA